MAKNNFYGVRVGAVPGIYQTWEECKQQIHGFPGALYQGFATRAAAEVYVYGAEQEPVVAGSVQAAFDLFSDESQQTKVNVTEGPLNLLIFPFYKAPDEIQWLSTNGGDEDHVYILFEDQFPEYNDFAEDIVSKMAKCDYERHHTLYDGRPCYVYITNHA